MKSRTKNLLPFALTSLLLLGILNTSIAQGLMSTAAPDSAQNIANPGSDAGWSITNPLDHNGTTFNNAPTLVCIDCVSEYAYFYDLGLNVAPGSRIDGIEIIYGRGGCNGGSFISDTLSLAHNGMLLGAPRMLMTPDSGATDTLGAANDLWAAALTDTIVNDGGFGVMLKVGSTGICTFGVWDLRMVVYYSAPLGVPGQSVSRHLTVFPNPAQSEVFWNSPKEWKGKEFKLLSPAGQVLRTGMLSAGLSRVDLQGLAAGTYVLEVAGEFGRVVVVE